MSNQSSQNNDINIIDVLKAKNLISKFIRETPLEYSRYYSDAVGAEVYLKLENLQLTGSYKIRGALYSMFSLSDEERARGVVVASSGNHAQGIGYAAKKLGVHATIVVPKNTPKTKIDAIRSYGIDLRIEGAIYDESEIKARQIEKQEKKKYISPYNDAVVIAGAGTIGLEILNQNPEIDIIISPIGGGGLFSGTAIAVKTINPKIKIFGAQSKASPPMHESLKRGKIVNVPMSDSIAEGLHGGIEQGSISFPIVQKYCEDILLVSEQEIIGAILTFLEHHHQICEGAAAVGLAALLRYSELFRGHSVGVIVSGGNLDYHQLKLLMSKKL